MRHAVRHDTTAGEEVEAEHGRLLDRGWRYDLEVWFSDTFLLRGSLRELRRRVLGMCGSDGCAPRSLLDVGCGTGTLAIEAARTLGPTARITGVDPAPRQIARARAKARRAGVAAEFRLAGMESLAFDEAAFDAVSSTLMLHHLPDGLRRRGLAEVSRVLRPGGRLVVADVLSTKGDGGVDEKKLGDVLAEAGFTVLQRDRLELPRAHHGWSAVVLLSATK